MNISLSRIGPYKVQRRIAEGGFAHVFLCEDDRGEQVVIKLHKFGEESRFKYEAEVMGRMAHDGVVRVLDSGRDKGTGRLYTVMEYIRYPTLETLMRQRSRLSESTTITVLRRIADALAYVYRHSAITAHRDIKPSNVFVRLDGDAVTEVKVSDFGIARVKDGMGTTATMGDPWFNSPEQIKGTVHLYSAATDIYSMGCLAFKMLSGQTPFDGDVMALVDAHISTPAPRLTSVLPEVNPVLAAIVDRCLKKKPSSRFNSMEEFLSALDGVDGGGAIRKGKSAKRSIRDVEAQGLPGGDGPGGSQDYSWQTSMVEEAPTSSFGKGCFPWVVGGLLCAVFMLSILLGAGIAVLGFVFLKNPAMAWIGVGLAGLSFLVLVLGVVGLLCFLLIRRGQSEA